MSDLRSRLDRKAHRLQPDADAWDRLLENARRRQTTRRRTALVVGMAVFLGGAFTAWTALRQDPAVRPAGETTAPEPTTTTPTEPTPTSELSPTPPPDGPNHGWVGEEERIAWQQQHGDGLWVAAYFLPDDAWETEPAESDLELRWKRIDREAEDLSAEEFLAASLAALRTPGPEGLVHPLEGVDLELRSATPTGSSVDLDFGPGIMQTNRLGSTGGLMMLLQFRETVQHYFPDASDVCVLIDGRSTADGSVGLFHDMAACPILLDDVVVGTEG